MKVAIMQPYVFPYIGYFQLIKTVDIFVFYDDVNFIKQGWINRNNLLINNQASLFTIPLIDSSSFKLINEIQINKKLKGFSKLLKSIEQAYAKAPYFTDVFPLVTKVFNSDINLISEFAILSVVEIANYLQLKTQFKISSIDFAEFKGQERQQRILSICDKLNGSQYINAIGGQELYSKDEFLNNNINLNFIKTLPIRYQQYKEEFIPWLSILDVLMFNSKIEVNKLLDQFELV